MSIFKLQAKCLRCLAMFFLVFVFASKVLATNNIEWKKVKCEFRLIDYNGEDARKKGTVLEALVKESNANIESLLKEDDGVIKIFEIKYKAPVKLKNNLITKEEDIIQFGLFRALDHQLQDNFEKLSNIRYAVADPILVQFVIDSRYIEAPAMITKTIDDKWKEK